MDVFVCFQHVNRNGTHCLRRPSRVEDYRLLFNGATWSDARQSCAIPRLCIALYFFTTDV